MVVLLTVGLSLATRTTQEVFLSQQEAESARVFNAAETGIEEALSQDFSAISGTTTLPSVNITDVSTATTIQPTNVLETQIPEGSAVHLNLDGYAGSTIDVQWSHETTCGPSASILATIYYEDGGERKITNEAFSPGDCRDDDFEVATTDPSGPYYRQRTIDLPTGPAVATLFARIRAVYNDTHIRVSGTNMPTQYFIIRAQADNDLGEESRTIEVGRTLSTAPSFMDYSLYSGTDITQSTP